MMLNKEIIINHNDANQRLDRFLRKHFKSISLSEIYKAIRTKQIKVNNQSVNQNYRLKINDKIFISPKLNFQSSTSVTNWNNLKQSFKVVYEDRNILAVFKPVGLLVHDDENKSQNTLANQVLKYLYEKNFYDPKNEQSFRPSLVHRLDRNTSGLVLVAKNAESLRILNEKIKRHEIQKFYLAKVHGIPDPKQTTLKAYLTKDCNNKLVTITKKPINFNSKMIETHYQVISHDQDSSILKIHLITGRTHQIRAHLNYINHPLFGEKKYSKPIFKDNLKYQALYAYEIIFKFQTDAGCLNYLNNQKITIPINLINF